jgi:hypothetical protein
VAYKFVTALQRALSDPTGYFQFQKEMQAKAMDQVFLNTFAGKTSFQAVVLPERIGSEDQATLGQAIRVRPIGIHDFLIPEPCEFSDEERIRDIILMHPVAYPAETNPFNRSGIDSTANEPQPIAFGDTVECFFADGPQYSGRLRGLRYRKSFSRSSGAAMNLECLNVIGLEKGGGTSKGGVKLAKAFDPGRYSSMADFVGAPASLPPSHKAPPTDVIDRIYKSFGKPLENIKTNAVKIFSVRYPVTTENANLFRDVMFACVKKEDGTWENFPFSVTTSPGAQFLGREAYTADGTANMASPQLAEKVYILSRHGRPPYQCLGQNGYLLLYRDFNSNGLPDNAVGENVKLVRRRESGLQIHRAKEGGRTKNNSGTGSSTKTAYYRAEDGTIKTTQVDYYTWSAGCQVFASSSDFDKFMGLIKFDNQQNGTNQWDYVIIDKEHYDLLRSKEEDPTLKITWEAMLAAAVTS